MNHDSCFQSVCPFSQSDDRRTEETAGSACIGTNGLCTVCTHCAPQTQLTQIGHVVQAVGGRSVRRCAASADGNASRRISNPQDTMPSTRRARRRLALHQSSRLAKSVLSRRQVPITSSASQEDCIRLGKACTQLVSSGVG